MPNVNKWTSKDGRSHYTGKQIACVYCGRAFMVQAYRRTAKYCSQEHYKLWRQLRDAELFKKRFWSKVGITTDPGQCWEWMAAKTHRYGNWGGYGKGTYYGKHYVAHRVAWEIANDKKVPEGMLVMHICDNPPCCNPKHLKLGTDKTNAEDKMAKGRNNPVHKLSVDQVREIKYRLAQGETVYKLAPLYGVNQFTIYAIKKKMTWKSVV